MKVTCIKNDYEETSGVFFELKETKYYPLTVDKTYEVMAVPLPDNWDISFVDSSIATKIELTDIMFLLYDDNENWTAYPTRLFKPKVNNK